MIEIAHDLMRRPRGIVRIYDLTPDPFTKKEGETALTPRKAATSSWTRRGTKSPPFLLRKGAQGVKSRLLYETDNLYVNAGLTVLANLLGAGAAGYVAAAVGFGSGNTPPTVNDTDLSSAPKYYNAIGTHVIGPSSSPAVAAGSVLFNYSLSTTDYAANPLTIQELGLFANSAAAALPVLVGGGFGAWTSGHGYSVGNLIIDSNGNTQRCTTAGTSGGSAPSWATTIGGTTSGDGGVTWTLVALHTAPGPMIAHVVVPSFPYAGAGNYSGTWTISM